MNGHLVYNNSDREPTARRMLPIAGIMLLVALAVSIPFQRLFESTQDVSLNERYCRLKDSARILIDGKDLFIQASAVRSAIKGDGVNHDGYDLYANPQRLMFYVKTPDKEWYMSHMTRLTDRKQGCEYYIFSEATQLNGSPTLF